MTRFYWKNSSYFKIHGIICSSQHTQTVCACDAQLTPDQNTLYYDFCLEIYVPQDHLLRQIAPFLDLDDLRDHLAAHYSHADRPSVIPRC
jgi:hypothetical protein